MKKKKKGRVAWQRIELYFLSIYIMSSSAPPAASFPTSQPPRLFTYPISHSFHPPHSNNFRHIHTLHSVSNPNTPIAHIDTTNNENNLVNSTTESIALEQQVEEDEEESRRGNKEQRRVVKIAWEKLVRWSRSLRSKAKTDVLERTKKVVVLGGGSFGTAMAAHVAGRKVQLEVNMLVRDPKICQSINEKHFNCKYFPEYKLPENVIATTDAKTALLGADFCLHAVPVQVFQLPLYFSSLFLEGVADYVDPGLPFISLSKGLELNTFRVMSQIIPQALKNPRQPYIVLSGPSFASELMNKLPTAMVVASKDKKLANEVQQLLASKNLRISTSSDVTGVEIAGALKNVLAIAAGIVEGMNLGNNSMAALVAQGCSEIRWLATKNCWSSSWIRGKAG
ncbi:glycerol-3-phosphate dehydrogenase [NAD(+)] 2, chloroplastic isoform X3 [Daucus carota subsp. sativus]|uniref:glycerol-3-phosphate dehydrogenase [NAD(+)] 2, chloroplastic isoform X3 n=1 Tax=Daucus carota subsp. sativus TaxID=79200 RepID=UPI003082AD20